MKNKIIFKMALSMAMLTGISSSVFAGEKVGNGGDLVVCRDNTNNIKSTELLDFYEARVLHGIQIKILGEKLEDKMQVLLQRIKDKDPDRENLYRSGFEKFFKEANILPGIVLTDVQDSDHIALPAGCAIEQLAIQKRPQFSQEKRYTINKDLWDVLSEDNKAGLIMHELIYRDFIASGDSNSINTRYLNSLLAADLIVTMSEGEYADLLRKLGLAKTTTFKGEWIALMEGTTVEWNELKYMKSFYPLFPLKIDQGSKRFQVHGMVSAFVDDTIYSGKLNSNTTFVLNEKNKITCLAETYAQFHTRSGVYLGKLEGCTPPSDIELNLIGNKYKIKIKYKKSKDSKYVFRIKFDLKGNYQTPSLAEKSEEHIYNGSQVSNVHFAEGIEYENSGLVNIQTVWREVTNPIFVLDYIESADFKKTESFMLNQQKISFKSDTLWFFPSENVRMGWLINEAEVVINGNPTWLLPGLTIFSENPQNEISAGFVKNPVVFSFQGKSVKLTNALKSVCYNPGGIVDTNCMLPVEIFLCENCIGKYRILGALVDDMILENIEGKEIEYKAGEYLEFNKAGMVVKVIDRKQY